MDDSITEPKPASVPNTPTTHESHAEDIAYTINHALSCATTDMLIAPTVSALFGVQVGCTDPTHTHGHAHEHAPKSSRLTWKLYQSEALHYFKGEVIGDLAAVPLTIMVQRLFPSAMDGIRHLLEPISSPFFKRGADRAAKRWGKKQGLPEDAPEIVARAQAMYHSEINHLPQAAVWNLFAFPIGVIGQKLGGHGSSVSRIIRNKSIGAIISNSILLGTRAMAPDAAEHWDKMNGEYVIVPATKAMGALLGVKEPDVDPIAAQSTGTISWTTRVKNDPPPTQTSGIA